jgi:hypothetical protein
MVERMHARIARRMLTIAQAAAEDAGMREPATSVSG